MLRAVQVVVCAGLISMLGSGVAHAISFGQDGITAGMQSRYMFETEADQQAGDVQISQTKAYVKFEQKAWDKVPFDIKFRVKHIDIVDTTAVDLPSHLEGRSIDFGVKLPIFVIDSDKIFMGFDVSPTMNTDGWDEWESGAFRIPFRSYAIYKHSDTFILVAGANIRPDYDRDVIPFVGFIYRPNDVLEFNFASNDPKITYAVSDTTRVRLELGLESDEYEVTQGTRKGVVFEYQEVTAGIGVEHDITDSVEATLSVGGVFARQLEYLDGTGKVDPEPGAYISFALKADF